MQCKKREPHWGGLKQQSSTHLRWGRRSAGPHLRELAAAEGALPLAEGVLQCDGGGQGGLAGLHRR